MPARVSLLSGVVLADTRRARLTGFTDGLDVEAGGGGTSCLVAAMMILLTAARRTRAGRPDRR